MSELGVFDALGGSVQRKRRADGLPPNRAVRRDDGLTAAISGDAAGLVEREQIRVERTPAVRPTVDRARAGAAHADTARRASMGVTPRMHIIASASNIFL